MNLVLEFIATLSAGLFTGGAIYISLVEHPARMSCGSTLAITEFAPSYKRAAIMQAFLAAISFLSAVRSIMSLIAFMIFLFLLIQK